MGRQWAGSLGLVSHCTTVCSITSGQSLSQGDIVAAVQKLHQGLTHLAARYQEVHTAVARLKLQYGVGGTVSDNCIDGCGAQVAGSRPGVRPPTRLAGPSPFLPPADPLTRARRDQQLGQAGPPAQPLGHNTAPAGKSTWIRLGLCD